MVLSPKPCQREGDEQTTIKTPLRCVDVFVVPYAVGSPNGLLP